MSNKKTRLDSIHFAVLATDVVCFRFEEGKLLTLIGIVSSSSPFKGKWALVGGLILPHETADESVERLLENKAGITDLYKEQLYTFSRVDRDPRGRVVSVAYVALTGKDPQNIAKASIKTQWYPVNHLPGLAYDHDEILKHALRRLQGKLRYTNIAQHLLPQEFTLSELQEVYEVVLGKGLDKRNFRKKILSTSILKSLKKTRKQGVMRPAILYTFASKKQEIVEIL